jgi:8-oxo-dGTP diphosphatase
MVTVDAVVFRAGPGPFLEVLAIRRKNPPFQGMFALPGGFVEMDETLDDAVARELEEETGLKGVELNQFETFGDVDRDPRGRVITVAYCGIVGMGEKVKAGDDAAEAQWMPVNNLPQLASDHNHVIARAMECLKFILIAATADTGFLGRPRT